MVAGGIHAPDSKTLSNIRAHIQSDSSRLESILSSAPFRTFRGGALLKSWNESPDMLKTAPKGIAKDHPKIDLLRRKAFAVGIKFSDAEATSEQFSERAIEVLKILKPLIDCLNVYKEAP
jgi:uncharacterized protein (DUF2461 family)